MSILLSSDFSDDLDIIKNVFVHGEDTELESSEAKRIKGKLVTDKFGFDVGSIEELLTFYFYKDEVQWLIKKGLLTAPASTKYHGNYEGGLFIHSILVGLELLNLTNSLGLNWINYASPVRIGILHDICKIDDYWFTGNDEHPVEFNDERIYPGHGDKSIIMLAGNVEINEQEKLCIRYHMGAFTDSKEWSFYSQACNKEPNVLYTHTADMIASQVRGI